LFSTYIGLFNNYCIPPQPYTIIIWQYGKGVVEYKKKTYLEQPG